MSFYAVLENGLVINTIVADSKEVAESITGKVCVEYEDGFTVLLGVTTHDGVNFINPAPEPASGTPREVPADPNLLRD